MKLIFAGTPSFAAVSLSALHAAGHQIALVLTQPDKPAGRGLKLKPSDVATVATDLGLPVRKPASLKDDAIQQELRALDAEVMVVAAYGLILPQTVLDIPKHGCLNIHGSLLPRWRGAAPIQRAIEAGDQETGISIMQMDAGLDTGPVLLTKKIRIRDTDSSVNLFAQMSLLGAELIIEALAEHATLVAKPQSNVGASYAKKVLKSEAKINWGLKACEIERRIRAFDPYPGCETSLNGETIKLWRSALNMEYNLYRGTPGEIIYCSSSQLVVACGEGALSVLALQKSGGKRLALTEFMCGTTVELGKILGK